MVTWRSTEDEALPSPRDERVLDEQVAQSGDDQDAAGQRGSFSLASAALVGSRKPRHGHNGLAAATSERDDTPYRR